ncbi:MAG: NAD(P)/FAD-dependent oxidoreductase [Lachnospiraceae bacterium]|nr:NAD(P)/FAD-dependent oxidoreductase [Lachnospiraceae bacterium]
MEFYRDHYDAVVVGGALAGLSAAISLAENGRSVLVLERHNMPGGIATSFVRGGVEIECALHEMMEIGPEGGRRRIGKMLEDHGVLVEWLPVPDAYRLILPDLDNSFHPGFETFASEAEELCPGSREKVLEFLEFCRECSESANTLQDEMRSVLHILKHHLPFVRTLGYTAGQVMDAFKLPDKVREILSPYWIYVGSPISELPFTVYAVVMNEYIGHGAYIPRRTSHEISLKLAERAEALGVQIEYRQEVEKILVKDGKAYGVRTKRGDEIHADIVVSGPYPHSVYGRMIEPASEVPAKALKMVHSRHMNLSAFSVILVLDCPKEALNLQDYCIFHAPSMDSEALYESMLKLEGPHYTASICMNAANPEASPEGSCIFSVTMMPRVEAFMDVTADTYDRIKHDTAEELIGELEDALKISLKDHIKEIVIETPVSYAHYVGSYLGGVYGYRHSMRDHTVARTMTPEAEEFIKGLYFTGAHGAGGDGMAPVIANGFNVARRILSS